MAPATATVVPAAAHTMVRHRRRHPMSRTMTRPNAGTSDSTPPTSAPQIGEPSIRIAPASTAIPIRRPDRGHRTGARQAKKSAAAAKAAYPALPNPMNRPATSGENPNALLNCRGLPMITSTPSTPTAVANNIITGSSG